MVSWRTKLQQQQLQFLQPLQQHNWQREQTQQGAVSSSKTTDITDAAQFDLEISQVQGHMEQEF